MIVRLWHGRVPSAKAAARALALALLIAIPAVGAAENAGGKRRVEVWAGACITGRVLDTTYTTAYSPTFGMGSVDSTAGQSLTVRGNRGPGAEIGVGWSPDGRWGVRLSAGRSAADLSGANGPYSWSVRYLALQPPDYQPRPIEIARQLDWPDTEGRLRVSTLALAVFRRWEGRRVGVGLSAGGAWLRASGEVRSLGYTTFHLGGHSTFFAQEFEIEASLDPASVGAFHAGADLDVALARSWRLRLGYRYLRASEASLQPRVTRVVNADEVLLSEPFSRIESDLALAPFRIDLSSSRLLLSLVFHR